MHISLIESDWDQDVVIASLNDKDREALSTPITRKDKDSGPVEAWFWAYQGENLRTACCKYDKESIIYIAIYG